MDDTTPGFFDRLQDPSTYGLLAAGLGILGNATGPNSGNAIGMGALQGLQAAQSAGQTQALNQYRKLQAAKLVMDAQKQQALLGLLGGAQIPGASSGQPPTDGAPAVAMPVTGAPTASPAVPGGMLARMSIDDVARIKALGGGDLTDAWKIAHFGQDRAPGSVNIGADGSRSYTPTLDKGQQPIFDKMGNVIGITNTPGAVKSAAEMTGATTEAAAEANAKYDLVPVPDGKGGTIMMPRSRAVGTLGSPSTPEGGLGTTPNPQVTAARTALPNLAGQTGLMLDTIDKVANHPGLAHSVGAWSLAPVLPGTDRADFKAATDQLKGQVFLNAYQTLRGGGQITEVEGAKAENALARLQNAQSEDAYRGALSDLRGVVTSARNRAYSQAGVTPPDASGVFSPKSAAEYQYIPSGSLFKDPNGTLRRKP